MPKAAFREEAEEKWEKLFAKLEQHQRDELLEYAGYPPDFSKVPSWLVVRLEEETKDKVAGVLAAMFLLAHDTMANDWGWLADPLAAAQRAQVFATQRSAFVARSMLATKLGKLQAATAQTFGTLPGGMVVDHDALQEAWSDVVDNIFSGASAKAAAMTEITKATTAGEKDYAQDFQQDQGKFLECFWEHRRPKGPTHPCELCQKLEHTPSTLWPTIVPDKPHVWQGPPAHPHCDCNLEWRELTLEQANSLGIRR